MPSSIVGKEISQNGLGLMRRGWLTNEQDPGEQAFRVLKAALNAGANIGNGAGFCGLPHISPRTPKTQTKVVLMINVVETKASSVGMGGLCWSRICRSARALVAGAIRSVADLLVPSHHRRFPVFQPDNLEQARAGEGLHDALVGALLDSGMPAIVLIPGARSEARVLPNVWDVRLTRRL